MSLKRIAQSFRKDRPVIAAIHDYGREYRELSAWLENFANSGIKIGLQLPQSQLSRSQNQNVMHSIREVAYTLGLSPIALESDSIRETPQQLEYILAQIKNRQPFLVILYDGTTAALKNHLPDYKIKWFAKPTLVQRLQIARKHKRIGPKPQRRQKRLFRRR